jgi:hypothetical protein
LLVRTLPCASSTAAETIFSLAISSMPSCWRRSSALIASASSGSVSASEAEKNRLSLDVVRYSFLMA